MIGRPIGLRYDKTGYATIKEEAYTIRFGKTKAVIWLKAFYGISPEEQVKNGITQIKQIALEQGLYYSVRLTPDRFYDGIEWVMLDRETGADTAEALGVQTQLEIAGANYKFSDASHPDKLQINPAPGYPANLATEHAKTLHLLAANREVVEYLVIHAPALLKQITETLLAINTKIEVLNKRDG
jgi:hypothetical protein